MVDVTKPIMLGIGLIVVMIAMIGMTPTVINQVETLTAAADTWNFTGHEGAEALAGLIPFGWIAGIAVFGIVGAFQLAKGFGSKKE